MNNFEQARMNMINCQLRTNKVTHDGVLSAFENVAREEYVPESSKAIAYVDEDLALDHGRYLMEPMVLARMLQTIDPQEDDTALVVGAGTGYTASVLAKLVSVVVAIEDTDDLVDSMNERFTSHGTENAVAVKADLTEGYPKQAPYDLIVFGGAVSEVPDALLEQLAEKGRLIAVVQDANAKDKQTLGHATLIEKHAGNCSGRVVFDANTPLLPGFEAKETFSF
ncbi:protein-L-isoaspartate O-methyltransferase family protein [Kiloniella majae]|uniref:protein-L-isoaspartate O-methyltransferase family protein n=1 Tax=Kiloniella majae TaxID=1938558 RepID=UPI000A278DE6|nr:protein-L-isoaspartate O-methyltransferase [Kiloniella majae]